MVSYYGVGKKNLNLCVPPKEKLKAEINEPNYTFNWKEVRENKSVRWVNEFDFPNSRQKDYGN